MKRTFPAGPAILTFTSDFHELLRGYLAAGRPVALRYDPLRIVPPGDDYVFGDPTRPIIVSARFGGHDEVCVVLKSAVGTLSTRQPDITGEGNMLTAILDIPDGARELELWFSFAARNGTVYDSDMGRNFHFGFARDQIEVLNADLVQMSGEGRFTLEVNAVQPIHHVSARVHAAKHGSFPSFDANLQPIAGLINGWQRWHVKGVKIPAGLILRFKLYYWIDDIRYKEDNDGLYYLVPPPPVHKIPPPPKDLDVAAKKWL